MTDPAQVAAGRTPHTPILNAAVLLLLVLVVFRLLLPAVRDEHFGIASTAESGGWTSDFAAILTFAKAFWKGKAGYDIESYLRVTSERVGRPVQHALPFPYAPTMLWILGPFCLLPDAWAYVVWILLAVAAVWWMVRREQSIWLAAAFFSPTALSCMKLGQTAILSATGLLVLMTRDPAPRPPNADEKWDARDWLDAIILWALTAKPPLALTAGIVLLASRRWRPVGLALGLTVLSTALLIPLLGFTWIHEYVHMMTHYDLDTADPVYVWSLVPQTMANLRAVLHVVFGVRDAVSSQVSSGLWLLALAGIVAAVIRTRLAAAATWGFTILAFLLFCPHVTSTDELQLVLILVLFTHPNPAAPSTVRWTAVGLLLTALYLAPGLGLPNLVRVPAAFADKLLLVGLVWAQWVRFPGRTLPRPAAAATS